MGYNHMGNQPGGRAGVIGFAVEGCVEDSVATPPVVPQARNINITMLNMSRVFVFCCFNIDRGTSEE